VFLKQPSAPGRRRTRTPFHNQCNITHSTPFCNDGLRGNGKPRLPHFPLLREREGLRVNSRVEGRKRHARKSFFSMGFYKTCFLVSPPFTSATIGTFGGSPPASGETGNLSHFFPRRKKWERSDAPVKSLFPRRPARLRETQNSLRSDRLRFLFRKRLPARGFSTGERPRRPIPPYFPSSRGEGGTGGMTVFHFSPPPGKAAGKGRPGEKSFPPPGGAFPVTSSPVRPRRRVFRNPPAGGNWACRSARGSTGCTGDWSCRRSGSALSSTCPPASAARR